MHTRHKVHKVSNEFFIIKFFTHSASYHFRPLDGGGLFRHINIYPVVFLELSQKCKKKKLLFVCRAEMFIPEADIGSELYLSIDVIHIQFLA